METNIFTVIIQTILAGGPVALIAILVCVIAYLLWEKRSVEKKHGASLEKLASTFTSKFDSERNDLMRIIDKYQEGNISVIQAINEIKVLLATISGKL